MTEPGRTSFADQAGDKVKTEEQEDAFFDVDGAAKKAPIIGSGVKIGEDVAKSEDLGADAGMLVSKGANFAAECAAEAVGFAMDPINWLVSNGLNMLIELIQPLQDGLHLVTGDGPALLEASGNFNAIAKGFEQMSAQFVTDRDKELANWTQDAGEAAKAKIGELAEGILGVGGTASGVADTLKMWSMVMQLIEDVIKAIISELVSWAIYTWLPALASSVVSFGASVAAAMAATVGKVASAAGRIMKKIGKVSKLLDDFAEFLLKWGKRLEGFKDAFKAYKAAGVSPLGLSKKAMSAAEMSGKQALGSALKAGRNKAVESITGVNPGSAGDSSAHGVKAVAGLAEKARSHNSDINDIAGDGKDDKYTADETRGNLDMGETVPDQPGVRRISGDVDGP